MVILYPGWWETEHAAKQSMIALRMEEEEEEEDQTGAEGSSCRIHGIYNPSTRSSQLPDCMPSLSQAASVGTFVLFIYVDNMYLYKYIYYY